MTNLRKLLVSSVALAASLPFAASPATAQEVCDVGGLPSGTAIGVSSLACGAGALALPLATAYGSDATANTAATAIGWSATAATINSIALGREATADGSQAIAIGAASEASGLNSIAIGVLANAMDDGAVAIGNASIASVNGVAVGNGASNGAFTNSVALGAGSTNTANNQVAVGGRTISGVAAGVAATDAVNVGQLNAAAAGINTSIGALQASVGTLFDENRQQDRAISKANEGVAMALALDSPNVPAGSNFAVSGGIGGYQGKHSLASAISAAVGEKATLSAGLGYGLDSGEVGYRAGFQFAF